MHFSIHVAGKTDVGRVRTNNEDNLGYDLRHGIFVVCDGMGGQAFGELASKVAVQTVLDYFARGSAPNGTSQGSSDSVDARMLADSVRAANAAVRAKEQELAERAGMGTTIVTLLLHQDLATIAHVGDSRIYLSRAGVLTQLTDDHSLVAEQVRRGVLTPEQAEFSSWQNILLKAIGAADEVEPDMREVACSDGDIFVLATDGLTRMVADQQMSRILNSAASLEAACEQLISAANYAGGEDNATCLLIKVHSGPDNANDRPSYMGPL